MKKAPRQVPCLYSIGPPQKQTLKYLQSTFSSVDRMQASASAQPEMDIDNLGSAHNPFWLLSYYQKRDRARVLQVKKPTPARLSHTELEISRTKEHPAPPTCTAAAAAFAGSAAQVEPDARSCRRRAPGPAAGREAGESAEPTQSPPGACRALGEKNAPQGRQGRAGNAGPIPLHRSARPGRARQRRQSRHSTSTPSSGRLRRPVELGLQARPMQRPGRPQTWHRAAQGPPPWDQAARARRRRRLGTPRPPAGSILIAGQDDAAKTRMRRSPVPDGTD